MNMQKYLLHTLVLSLLVANSTSKPMEKMKVGAVIVGVAAVALIGGISYKMGQSYQKKIDGDLNSALKALDLDLYNAKIEKVLSVLGGTDSTVKEIYDDTVREVSEIEKTNQQPEINTKTKGQPLKKNIRVSHLAIEKSFLILTRFCEKIAEATIN